MARRVCSACSCREPHLGQGDPEPPVKLGCPDVPSDRAVGDSEREDVGGILPRFELFEADPILLPIESIDEDLCRQNTLLDCLDDVLTGEILRR